MSDKKRYRIIWDCDDTIWDNIAQYNEAYIKLIQCEQRWFGNKMPGDIMLSFDRLLQIERENAKNHGVRFERIALSMQQHYDEICQYIFEAYGTNNKKPEHIDEIAIIAKSPFDYTKVEWIQNVKTILRFLKKQGHEFRFIPSYDERIFRDRIEYLGLYEFASPDQCDTTAFAKTTENFKKVSGWSPEINDQFDRWYFIGNGKNDILPAVDISEKCWGIYIRRGSTSPWFHGDTLKEFSYFPDPIDHPRVYNIKRFTEILNIIE